MLSDFKITFKHTSIYGITNILKKGAAFFMIPVYTRYLSPADYGTLELLELTLDVILLLVGVRLTDSIIRYYNHYEQPDDQNEVISTALIFSFFMTILVAGFCTYFADPISRMVFKASGYTDYFRWIFVCLGFQLMFVVPETFLLVKKKSLTYSGISFSCFVVSLSLNIYFLVVLKYGVWGMVYSMAITKLFNIVILLVMILPGLKLSFSLQKLQDMLKFGVPMIPGAISLFIINFSDRFFIQRYCDTSELGIYSLGYKFGLLLTILISDPFFRIWNTQRFEILKKPDGSKIVGQYFSLYFFGLLFFALGISVFAKDIIHLMAETQYLESSSIIPLIAVSYIFQGLSNFSTLGIMLTYRTNFIMYSHVLAAFINLFLNWVLIQRYGIHGAAFSTIITFLILFITVHAISQRLYYFRLEYVRLLKMVVFSAMIFLSSLLIDFGFFPSLVLKSVLCLLLPFLLVLPELKKNLSILKQGFRA